MPHEARDFSVFPRYFRHFSFLLVRFYSLFFFLLLLSKQLSRRKSKDCAKLYATVCYTCSKRCSAGGGAINVGLVPGQGRAGQDATVVRPVRLFNRLRRLLAWPKATQGGQLKFDMYPRLRAATSINKVFAGRVFSFRLLRVLSIPHVVLVAMYTRFG